MLISLNWLKGGLQTDNITDEELVKLIGARLVEVEGVIDQTHKYDNIYAVKVMYCEAIEGTHLHLCKIDDGGKAEKVERDKDGYVQVMCGAPNVHEGMFAVWIAPGAIVPQTFNTDEPFEIGMRKMLKQYDSYGMMAGADELDFGDNDTLSALVASIVGADLLILLSDIDGLYTDDPHSNPDAKLLDVVDSIDEQIYEMAKDSTGSNVGTGGMATKLAAAKIATFSGTDMIIANGKDVRILQDIFQDDYVGTLFTANENPNFNVATYVMETIG